MTADGPLTGEQIVEAAEDVLRRYGPAKATVVDVARALGVSHGSVYRHFPSKAALRNAVTAEWLARVSEPLEAIAHRRGTAPARLHRWLRTLIETKRGLAGDDPELFATYLQLVSESGDAVAAHVEELTGQLAAIVAEGVARGEVVARDPAATGRAIFDATARFHNPAHAAEWSDQGIDDAFERVWTLLLDGLRPRSTATRGPARARRASRPPDR